MKDEVLKLPQEKARLLDRLYDFGGNEKVPKDYLRILYPLKDFEVTESDGECVDDE